VQLADVLASVGHTDEARAALTPLAANDPDWPTVALANVAVREGQLEEATALLFRHLAAHPNRRHVHYMLTSLLPHLGRFDEANRHAARGTLVTCGDLQLTSSRVIRFPEQKQATSSVIPFARRVWHEFYAAMPNIEAVYVVGCDSRYFLLFGEALVNSLARRAGARLLLHLHLVNPDSAAEALLERLRTKLALPIACSRESVDFSTFSERQRRTYLSCARYLILPDLLERYGKPMIVADADQLVVADLRPLLSDLSQNDVGLLRDDRQITNILSLISASVLAVNCSAGGLRFARTLCDTITERMTDSAGLGWHLDQAGLAVAHLWHRDIRTLRLAPHIMDSVIDPMAAPDALDSRALFWSITFTLLHNGRKLKTSLFRQFLEPEPS
jgi:hypothetical protein